MSPRNPASIATTRALASAADGAITTAINGRTCMWSTTSVARISTATMATAPLPTSLAEAGVEDVGAGMSVCWLDYDNDGKQDLYVADMWTAAGNRVSEQESFQKNAGDQARAFYRKHAMGNSMFHNRGGEHFEDAGSRSGTTMGRWSWCSDAWDFDHDGFSGSVHCQWHDFRNFAGRLEQFLSGGRWLQIRRRNRALTITTTRVGARSTN